MEELLRGLREELVSIKEFYEEKTLVQDGESVVACFDKDDELKRVYTAWQSSVEKAERARMDGRYAKNDTDMEQAEKTFTIAMASLEMWKKIFGRIVCERYALWGLCGITVRSGYQIVMIPHDHDGITSILSALDTLVERMRKTETEKSGHV